MTTVLVNAAYAGIVQRTDGRATLTTEYRRLCISLSAADGFDAVWFAVQAVRLYHPEVAGYLSFAIVDFDADAPDAPALAALCGQIPRLYLVPAHSDHDTPLRDRLFHDGYADIICHLDQRALLPGGAFAALLSWFDDHPNHHDVVRWIPPRKVGAGGWWSADPLVDNPKPERSVFASRHKERWSQWQSRNLTVTRGTCVTSALPYGRKRSPSCRVVACCRSADP